MLINVQRKQRWTPRDSCFGVSELSASLVLAVEAFCFICLQNTPGCFSYLAAAPDIEVWDVRKVTHTASLEPPVLALGAAGGFGATFPSQQPQSRGTASLAWPLGAAAARLAPRSVHPPSSFGTGIHMLHRHLLLNVAGFALDSA